MLCRLLCCFPTNPQGKKEAASQPRNAPAYESARRPGSVHGEEDVNNPYWPTCPLPRYTERPMSIYEKTIVFGRGPNPQNQTGDEYPRDEKRQQDSNNNNNNNNNNNGGDSPEQQRVAPVQQHTGGDHSSDASSMFSIPSSYGNTSTATRSPPPAYSAPTSCATSQRTPSISLTCAEAEPDATQAAMRTGSSQPSSAPQLQHPQPVLYRGQNSNRWVALDSTESERRLSWESGRSNPTLPPPAYPRR